MTAQARMTAMATMKAPADPAISEVFCAIVWKKSFIVGTFLRDSYTHGHLCVGFSFYHDAFSVHLDYIKFPSFAFP